METIFKEEVIFIKKKKVGSVVLAAYRKQIIRRVLGQK